VEKDTKDLEIQIKPWKNKDYDKSQHILLLLQNPIDTSLNSLIKSGIKYDDWIIKVIDTIKSITNKKIRVRLHPRFQGRFTTDRMIQQGVEMSQNYDGWNKTNGGQSLYEDLKNSLVLCYLFE